MVFDRMAVDFRQMLKRKDIDYYLKGGVTKHPGKSGLHRKGGGGAGGQTELNDSMAFYSEVPGYCSGAPSPVSLVAYRVNGLSSSNAYNKLERLGKGLLWNGISNLNANNRNSLKPMFFLPVLISGIWPAITDNSADPNGDYEIIGPGVIRLEYSYLLKRGKLNDSPWDDIDKTHSTIDAFSDVEAIAVTIAVIDSKNRSLLGNANILELQERMSDFKSQKGNGPVKTGQVEAQWSKVISDPVAYPTTATMPKAALSSIRIYSRYFDLRVE
jgi:hypothetical protein